MPDASPPKWHLAHTTWFFETFVLQPQLANYKPVDSNYAYLFNSYYNSAGPQWNRAQRGLLSRPTVSEVFDFRHQIDTIMSDLLLSDMSTATRNTIILGLNHEQQHQELLLMDLKHAFSLNPLAPAYSQDPVGASDSGVDDLRWVGFDEGVYCVGHKAGGFAFDNEGPAHRVLVESFELADRLVTHGEYRQFVEAGGYQRPELWLSDGWACLQENQWQAPLYWKAPLESNQHFTCHGVQELRESAPVSHLSYYEADAYARWAGCRLPTEMEWEVGASRLSTNGAFLESQTFEPNAAERRTSAGGIRQLLGDVWEWTQSPYTPYPRYSPPPGALGEYNGKFMCNQMVLRGGSCLTPQDHIRHTYRNFFPPHSRWMVSGLRLARNVTP